MVSFTELLRQGPMCQGKLDVAWRAAVGDALSRVTTVRLQANGPGKAMVIKDAADNSYLYLAMPMNR